MLPDAVTKHRIQRLKKSTFIEGASLTSPCQSVLFGLTVLYIDSDSFIVLLECKIWGFLAGYKIIYRHIAVAAINQWI